MSRSASGTATPSLPDSRPDRPSRRLCLWRLSALRRDGGAFADHARGQGAGRARHAGARHLQRLPDPDRGRDAAGRVVAEPLAQASPAATCICASRTTRRSSPAATTRARRSGCRWRITTATTPPTPTRSTGSRIEGLVAFRYCGPTATLSDADNFNGSARAIAGIFNDSRTVLGLMPHPENATDPLLGGTDGSAFFDGLVGALQ